MVPSLVSESQPDAEELELAVVSIPPCRSADEDSKSSSVTDALVDEVSNLGTLS